MTTQPNDGGLAALLMRMTTTSTARLRAVVEPVGVYNSWRVKLLTAVFMHPQLEGEELRLGRARGPGRGALSPPAPSRMLLAMEFGGTWTCLGRLGAGDPQRNRTSWMPATLTFAALCRTTPRGSRGGGLLTAALSTRRLLASDCAHCAIVLRLAFTQVEAMELRRLGTRLLVRLASVQYPIGATTRATVLLEAWTASAWTQRQMKTVKFTQFDQHAEFRMPLRSGPS
jgi:hypothetical protein